ncbi:hypothetical protein V7266_28725 [Neobacillus drentensis]|uniref:hypothetical protein n=1 Tax=Neobacillus drentensis TaxID=220684 RepID=UPI002FFE777A
MTKQSNQITEEQFREICKEAGVTTDELIVRNGQEFFTVEGIKKLRFYLLLMVI